MKQEKAIGNKGGANALQSFAIDDVCGVLVTARREQDGEWSFSGVIDGEVVITGTIHGGKARAARYIRFIRNGILSRRMKGKVNPQKGGAE